MSEPVEVSGRTVEDAIAAALEMLGAREDEVEIRILSEGDEHALIRGEARVLARYRDERSEEDLRLDRETALAAREQSRRVDPADALAQATAVQAFLEGLLDVMDLDADVDVVPTSFGAAAEITGEDLGLLIGRHGSTMGALQELSRAVAQKHSGARATVSVDVEGYMERRTEMLERMAHGTASRVVKSQRSAELEPMPARDRKIVHDALVGFAGVRTESEGEEPFRMIVIHPAR